MATSLHYNYIGTGHVLLTEGVVIPLKMRKIADLPTPKDMIVRAMIYDDCAGVYLFLYDRQEDGPGIADYWFESLEDAESTCMAEFGIAVSDWKYIADPRPGCQHDWINPTRIKCDSDGNKLWGQFEPANDAVSGADCIDD